MNPIEENSSSIGVDTKNEENLSSVAVSVDAENEERSDSDNATANANVTLPTESEERENSGQNQQKAIEVTRSENTSLVSIDTASVQNEKGAAAENRSNVDVNTNDNSCGRGGNENANPGNVADGAKRTSERPPARRLCKPKRNVNINSRPVLRLMNDNSAGVEQNGRPKRISVPVPRFNYGFVRCSVCGKSFYQDLAIEHYGGYIACSFECSKKEL